MQQNQIIPKYNFPSVETYVNDYSLVSQADLGANTDSTITQAYAVLSPKGLDNRWVKVVNRSEAIRIFGNSKFKEYGQPLLQALNVLNKDGAAVWFCRVMPENATYSNKIVSAYYKADSDSISVLDRKFRIKIVGKTKTGINDADAFNDSITSSDMFVTDSEGFAQVPLMGVRYTGRGKAGNNYSLRINQSVSYEKEYGIKMYNFEMLDNSTGLVKESTVIGSLISSDKYATEDNALAVLISDRIYDADPGYIPISVEVSEENIETLYNNYILFANKLHEDAIAEYESKLEAYDIPADMLDGTVPVTSQYQEQYDELQSIAALIEATEELPELDEFDPLFGKYVADPYSTLPGILYPSKLTDDIDTTDPEFNADDYTTTELVDFASIKGLILESGDDGYFDNPRTELDERGNLVQWTKEQEIEDAMIKAFDGTYDRRICSPRRIPISVFFDANYPYNVKRAIVERFLDRDDARVYLDAGIINSFNINSLVALTNDYGIFDSKMVSVETQNYTIKEYSSKKRINVTTNYFLSAAFVDHVRNRGIEIPFVRGNCRLSGHVRDSLKPIVEEYDVDVKETLVANRLNFFEVRGENDFRRAVQNTTQKSETDFLEENNALIFYELKRQITEDCEGQIYNFADSAIREDFVIAETTKYASIKGQLVENIEFDFVLSDYEFEHSILHFYTAITFRGLTKKVIFEVDINKRQRNVETEE